MTESALLRAIRLEAPKLTYCSKCGLTKSLADFSPGVRSNGTTSWCKQCCNSAHRAHYAANREKEIARAAAWNKRNPKRVAVNMQRCRDRRPEHFRAYYKAYYATHPAERRMHDYKKKAMRAAAIGDDRVSTAEWNEIQERYDYLCFYCHDAAPLTMDHAIPLVRGGKHVASNIVPACRSCNGRKWKRTTEEFIAKWGDMGEMDLVQAIRLDAPLRGARLMRNNTGVLQDVRGNYVRYGIGVGGSDLIGWTIRHGRAIFTAIECKLPGKKPTMEQAAFIAAVKAAGGIAGCAHSVEEFREIIASA